MPFPTRFQIAGANAIFGSALILASLFTVCSSPVPTGSPAQTMSTVAPDPRLVVVGAGKAHCGTPPFGCFVTFSIRPPDEAVDDRWEPGRGDAEFTMPGTGRDEQPVHGEPVGLPPTISVGRHTLIGAASSPNDVVGGSSPGLNLLWTFQCSVVVDVLPSTSLVEVTVTFVPDDDQTCRIDVRQS